MQLIMVGIGSYGDVYPLVGLGSALKNRGHHVTMLANAYFKRIANEAGLAFKAIGSTSEYQEFSATLNRRRPINILCDHLYLRPMRPVYDYLTASVDPLDTIIVCNISALGARLAREKHGIPMVSVNTSPMMFMSSYDFPLFFLKSYPTWLPRIFYRIARRVIHFAFDRRLCPSVNTLRQDLGLNPRRDILSWMVSPDKLIGLFPPWFGHPQPDWPLQTELIGFPFFDEGTLPKHTLPAEVTAFFEQGAEPILFTPGTPNGKSAQFFAKAMDAIKLIDARAIFLTPFKNQVPDELPPSIRHFDYLPFSKIFHRIALLVHHGGIGTVARALQNGLPQLIAPWGIDQHDNGGRIKTLGAGDMANFNRCTPRKLAEKLDRLLQDRTVLRRCRQLSVAVGAADAPDDFCRIIEAIAGFMERP